MVKVDIKGRAMGKTIRGSYRGWAIAIRCMSIRKPNAATLGSGTHVASGHAVFEDAILEATWIDTRPQLITGGLRSFNSGEECTEILLFEMKALIDGLEK